MNYVSEFLKKAKSDLPVFIDIDGRLTDNPNKRGGTPLRARIDAVKKLIAAGQDVVIWSYAGSKYAEEFARANGIKAVAAIGKPKYLIDDNKNIVPMGMSVRDPAWLDADR